MPLRALVCVALIRRGRRTDRRVEGRDVALGLVSVCGRAGVTAGRVALVPFRVAARLPVVGPVLGRAEGSLAEEGRTAGARGLDQLQAAAGDVLASPQLERAVDQALAGPLPEAVVRSVIDRQVVERVAEQALSSADIEAAVERTLEHDATERLVEQLLASPGFERLVVSAVESQLAANLTERLAESPEIQRLVEEIASSPAVRAALVRQTATLGDEVATGLRRRTECLDDAAERTVHRLLHRTEQPQSSLSASRTRYGGLGARGIAFAADLVISTAGFLVGAAVVWLVSSLVGGLRPSWLAEFLASAGWVLVVGAYLVLFWHTAGQTPGMRLMGLRVADPRGDPPSLGRSVVRLVGLVLAIVPLFAGFLPVLVDHRRRALQDFLAGTTVRAEHALLPVGESVAKGAPPDGRPPVEASPGSPVQLD
jgi:uncharacterized RDD family membrane protein YckC